MKEYSADMVNAAGESFGELIRRCRRAKGMSQEQLGALVHVKKNAVGAWEAGRSRPDLAGVPILCEALGLTVPQFFGLSEMNEERTLLDRFERLSAKNQQAILHQIEVLYQQQEKDAVLPREIISLFQNDLAVSAGPLSYLSDNGGKAVYLIKDEITALADELIRVSGDSMEPVFFDGDFVLVQHTQHLKEGEIGIFVNGSEGFIKEFRKDGLYSYNPEYSPIRFTESDSFRCIGRILDKLKQEQRASRKDIAEYLQKENPEGLQSKSVFR